jgi:hypothetical protein
MLANTLEPLERKYQSTGTALLESKYEAVHHSWHLNIIDKGHGMYQGGPPLASPSNQSLESLKTRCLVAASIQV